MPVILQLAFPGRGYHATPWGSHVNEGHVEWPPSPWRLLRALLSTGFTKLGWAAARPPDVACSLIERLAAIPPSFTLPPVSLAHTRHYVDAADKRPLIFDAWAHLEDVVEVIWDVELPAPERSLLATLAEHLGYLGRAESWVDARLVDGPPTSRGTPCRPDAGGPPGPRFEPLRVLCPQSAATFVGWRAEQVATIEAALLPASGKSMTVQQQKKFAKAKEPFPADLIAALCADTGVIQAQGWSAAPGSREVVYWRRADALSTGTPQARSPSQVPAAAFALLAITTPSRGTSALPPLSRVFPQGRLLHRALASIVNKQFGGDPALALSLLGRDGEGPSIREHRHAHALFLDLDGDQRLDHALIFAPMGLDGAAQAVLRRLRRTFMKGGAGELQLALAGLGDANTLRLMVHPLGDALTKVLGQAEGAADWISATPYVAPRLLKTRGRDSLDGLIRSECAARGFPPLLSVAILDRGAEDEARTMRHYVLHDDRHQPPMPVRWSLRLRFEGPVRGPICLGYGAHVGLGRFAVSNP